MTVEDYVKRTLLKAPDYWKSLGTYEEARLMVLDHAFFCGGNGFRLANTENPEEGGYLVIDSPDAYHKSEDDVWTLIKYDLPYGLETCEEEFPEDYFDDKGSKRKYFPSVHHTTSITDYNNTIYKHLQKDWFEALIVVTKRAIDFFEDGHQYKYHYMYPTKRRVEEVLENIAKCKKQKDCPYKWYKKENGEYMNRIEIASHLRLKWRSFKQDQLDFLYNILSDCDKTAN